MIGQGSGAIWTSAATTGGDNLLIHINPTSLPWPDKPPRGFLAALQGTAQVGLIKAIYWP